MLREQRDRCLSEASKAKPDTYSCNNIGVIYPFTMLTIKDNSDRMSKYQLLLVSLAISNYAGLHFEQANQLIGYNDKYKKGLPNWAFEKGKQDRLHLHIVLESSKKVNGDHFTKWLKSAKIYDNRQAYDQNDNVLLLDNIIDTKSLTVNFKQQADISHHWQTLKYLTKETANPISLANECAFIDE